MKKLKVNKADLVLINNLIQVSSATKENRIPNYILEFNKELGSIFVEIYQPLGRYAVCLRKEMDGITKNELIPISNSVEFGEILSKVIESEVIDLSVKDNKVIIKTPKSKNMQDDITLPYYEEDEDELSARNNLKEAFYSRDYGDPDNTLTFYERSDPEDKEPSSVCKIDLQKLNIKNITEVFEGQVEISTKNKTFFLKVGGKKAKTIKRTIKKENKEDQMNITGECTVLLQEMSCFTMLSKFSGFVQIDLKKEYPLVLKKKFPDKKLGLCYLISMLEED